VPNLAHVLKHVCIVLAAAGSLEVLGLQVHDQVTAANGRSRRLLLAVASAVALGVLFVLSPAHSAETRSLTVATATDGYMLAYWSVYILGLGTALVAITRTMAQFARHTERSPVRTTFALMATGTGIGVLYLAHKTVFLAFRVLDVPAGQLVTHHDQVSTLLVAGSLIPLVIGLAWQYLRRLPVARHAAAYRSLGILSPLWWRLYEATPQIALTPPLANGRERRPGPRDVEYCLQRRVVEIRDGALALRPYLGTAEPADFIDVLAELGVKERDQSVVADATWYELARRAKLAGVPPTSDPITTADGAGDLAGEIRNLSRVAKTMRDVTAAADTVQARQKADAP